MTRERVHRKLCAIFSADVKGYSQLMRADEVGTVQTKSDFSTLLRKPVCRKSFSKNIRNL